MRLARQGDAAAFAALVARHRQWLQRFLYHLFWSQDEAEDGVQEVFLRLWLARHRYEPSARLRTYLFTLARTYWLNRSNRQLRPRQIVSLEDQFGPGARRLIEQMADRDPTPEAVVIARYERFRLRRMVDGLPEKQRLVFIMSHFLDMRYAEIGETLGIPEGTVKSRMFHAVANLRERLTRQGGEGT